MDAIKKVLVVFTMVVGLFPVSAYAETVSKPILVVDKCPEFCPKPRLPILVVDRCPQFCPKPPKPSLPPKPSTPPIQMCTQALIPVPNKPGYWYTDGCMKKIIGPLNGGSLVGKAPSKK